MDCTEDSDAVRSLVEATCQPLPQQTGTEAVLKEIKLVSSETLTSPTIRVSSVAGAGVESNPGDLFEHRFVWNFPAVSDLISLVKSKQSKFSNPHIKRKTIWREIGKTMFEKGYPVTSDLCERKWRNLRGTYKAILYKCEKNPKAKKSWEFFHDMNHVLKDDPALNTLSFGGGGSSLADTVEPQAQPTTIRVVSTGGATYHIIEQPPSRPKPAPVLRNKTQVPCRIESVTSLSLPKNISSASPGLQNSIPRQSSSATSLLSAPGVLTSSAPAQGHSGGSKRRSQAETEPQWFLAFKKEMRESNERNLREIREMHRENIQILKERNQVIRGLVLALLKASDVPEVEANVADALVGLSSEEKAPSPQNVAEVP